MTRSPLMLSDTAMVLLRRSVESTTQIQAVDVALAIETSTPIPGGAAPWYEGIEPASYYDLSKASDYEMMFDIWLMWSYPDLVPERHLGWHLLFDQTLMNMAEKTFVSPQHYTRNRTRFLTHLPQDLPRFVGALHIAYREALMRRTTTPGPEESVT